MLSSLMRPPVVLIIGDCVELYHAVVFFRAVAIGYAALKNNLNIVDTNIIFTVLT